MKSSRTVKIGVAVGIFLAVFIVGHHPGAMATDQEVHWGYSGSIGPEFWGELSEDFAMCSKGQNQSPINITKTIEAELSGINLSYNDAATEILNNGHAIQVNYAPGGTMTIEGRTYELKQYHFHAPSENLIDGKSFAMEAHFVHADEEGRLAVIGVVYDLGAANPVLEKLWQHMPETAGQQITLNESVDPMGLLPAEKDYYRFNGSLTTPPCTEGVLWMVMAEPKTVSKEQLESFSHAMHGPNNRPVQPVNARLIVHSD